MNLILLTSWIGLKTQWRKFVFHIPCYLSLETGVIISLMYLLTQGRYAKMGVKKTPLPYFLLILTLYCIAVHIPRMCKWDPFSLNLQVLGWVEEFSYEWLWLSFPSEVMQQPILAWNTCKELLSPQATTSAWGWGTSSWTHEPASLVNIW